MDNSVMIVVIVCLLVLFFVFFLKYIILKRQIKSFGRQVENRKDVEYGSPIKVDNFDRDIIELAVKLNEHTDIQRVLAVEYKRNKEQLNNIISGISHDFRTPLTASLGYLQMIEKSGGLSDKNAEYLNIAIQKNMYLKELSDEFFELSKLENGKDELHLEEVNLSNLLTEMILEQHAWIAERGVSADFEIADGIVIQTDVHSLTRILHNLMSNAKKYTGDSFGVTLFRDSEHITFYIYNSLTNNDSYIDIARVFEPFYRTEARTTAGSGLGLYVVKLLCDRFGWIVTAEIADAIFSVKILI